MNRVTRETLKDEFDNQWTNFNSVYHDSEGVPQPDPKVADAALQLFANQRVGEIPYAIRIRAEGLLNATLNAVLLRQRDVG